MRSYSFCKKEYDGNLWQIIYSEIERNEGYFRKFWGDDAPEAMQLVLRHCLSHYDEEKGNLKYYIIALARTIKKVKGDLVFVDFMDKTLSSKVDNEDSLQVEVDLGSIKDFSDTIIDEMYMSIDRSKEVVDLALSFMDMFILLCEALINRDSSTKYYSKVFIEVCLRLSKRCKDFNSICIDIYKKYGDAMKEFLSYENDKDISWKEADYTMLESRRSRRIIMIDKFGNEIIDADRQPFRMKGSMKGKYIVKVAYEDVYNKLCDIYDYEIMSPIKFTIGSRSVVRTFGGSWTVVNPEATNVYELIKTEIITNILIDTGCRYLNIGSECVYLLCSDKVEINIPSREILGVELNFPIRKVCSDDVSEYGD